MESRGLAGLFLAAQFNVIYVISYNIERMEIIEIVCGIIYLTTGGGSNQVSKVKIYFSPDHTHKFQGEWSD